MVLTAAARIAQAMVAAAAIASASACATRASMELGSSRTREGESTADVVSYYLPKQLVAIDLERRATSEHKEAGVTLALASYEDTLTLRLLPPVPDAKRRFIVRVPHTTGRGEAFAVQTTEAGLLTSAGASAADRSGQVLDRIVLSAAASSMLLADHARTATGVVPAACILGDGGASTAPVQSLKTTVIVDPTESTDLERAESQLASLGAHYRFELTKVGPSRPRVIKSAPGDDEPSLGVDFQPRLQRAGALFYRRPQPYVLAVYRPAPGSGGEQQFVSATQVSLVNEAPIERTLLSAATSWSYESARFQDGMLGVRPAPLIAGISADAWKALLPKRPHFRFKFSSSNEPAGASDPAEPPDPQLEIVKAVLALKKAEEEQSKGK